MRERMFTIVERSRRGDLVSKCYDVFIMTVAIISVMPLMFRDTEIPRFMQHIDIVTVYILFLDYILRWMTHDYRTKKHTPVSFVLYPVTPYAVMDIVSILPSIGLLPKGFMILRLLRLTKIFHYSRSFAHVVKVFKNERKTLSSVLIIAVFYIFVSALVMFVHEPDTTFSNFFDALYWATTALTTVGYGDVFPHSDVGKMISMISSLFGVAIIALPAGIVTAGFVDAINKDIKADEEEKLQKKVTKLQALDTKELSEWKDDEEAGNE